MTRPGISLVWAVAVALSGCSSKDDRLRERILSRINAKAEPAPFDWSKPEAALSMSGDEAAARLGSFEWSGTATWVVAKADWARIRVAERHHLRQLASGDFAVESDLDPDPGARRPDSGKRIVYAGKMTYARGRYVADEAYRERPTDHGRDARRFRDESFDMGGDLAALVGPALVLSPAGEATLLSRTVKRFTFSMRPDAPPPPAPSRPAPPAGGLDPDTQRHFALPDGRIPSEAAGELLADAETGVPLKLSLRASFRVKDDPDARVDVELASEITGLGSAVAPVLPPAHVLPDERKPRGVARALEAAGLRKGKPDAGVEEEEEEAAAPPEKGSPAEATRPAGGKPARGAEGDESE